MLHNTDISRHASWHPTFVATSKLHYRRYSLIFGPDGQATLVGPGTETPSYQASGNYPDSPTTSQQPPETVTPSQTPLPSTITGLYTVSETNVASVSAPRFAASSASPSDTITSAASTLQISSLGPLSPETTADPTIPIASSTPTDTGSTPSATSTSSSGYPGTSGYNVPFYIAVVLSSFCAVACISAFIAWLIRKRPKSRPSRELYGPWEFEPDQESVRGPILIHDRKDVDMNARNEVATHILKDVDAPYHYVDINSHNDADAHNPNVDTHNRNDAGTYTHYAVGANNHSDMDTYSRIDMEDCTDPRFNDRPLYRLPATIVPRSEPSLLLPLSDERALRDCICRDGFGPLGQGPYPSFTSSRDQNYLHSNSSMTTMTTVTASQRFGPRPHVQRVPTEASVQESTRTLGTLHVANMMPGDVTSGDEGINRGGDGHEDVRLTPTDEEDGRQSIARTASIEDPKNVGIAGSVVHGRYGRVPADRHRAVSVPVDGNPEPPGLATVPWGRRTSASAALRHTRGGASNVNAGTRANVYGGNWRQMPPSGPSLAPNSRQGPTGTIPSSAAPQGWTDTLRSGFMHALDVVAGNRTPVDSDRSRENGHHFAFGNLSSAPGLAGQHGIAHHDLDHVLPTGPSMFRGSYWQSQSTASQPSLLKPPDTKRRWKAEPRVFLAGNKASTESSTSFPVPYGYYSTNALGRNAFGTTQRPRSALASTMSIYSTDSGYGRGTRSGVGLFNKGGDVLQRQPRVSTPGPGSNTGLPDNITSVASQPENSTAHSEDYVLHSESTAVPSERSTLQEQHSTARNTAITRKKGVVTRRKRTSRPPAIRRVSSTASSILSLESSVPLSAGEAAARKALLERRKKLEVVLSLERRGTLSRAEK